MALATNLTQMHMKLVNKFTIWYLCIAMMCTCIGTYVTYRTIKSRIDTSAAEHMKSVNDAVALQLSRGITPARYINGKEVVVKEVADVNKQTEVSRVCNAQQAKAQETLLTVSTYHTINGKKYKIITQDHVTSSDQILTGLEISILWKWVLILGLIGVSAKLVSRLILGPFNRTLKLVDSFNLRQKKKLEFEKTNTVEFNELNALLKRMTDKAVEDYKSLKEFSENASHELQTPVAVMRGKLELLMQSGVQNDQAILINDLQNALDKLARINSSLTLLARLENEEFEARTQISVSEVLLETVDEYTELAEMKGIKLKKKIAPGAQVVLHEDLLQLLLNNLLSNCIRHNTPDGQVVVALTANALTISNTGRKPEVPTQEMFQRFKKGSHCQNSIGIGLAIVQQICDLHGYSLRYDYADGWHTLQVGFDGAPVNASAISHVHQFTVSEEASL